MQQRGVGVFALLALLVGLSAVAQPVAVRPTRETQAISGGGSLRGVAVWRHPTDPASSLLLVAESGQVGLVPYNMDGTQRTPLSSEGLALGVDVQEDFSYQGVRRPLVVVANGTLQGLVAYVVDPTQRTLQRADAAPLFAPSFAPEVVSLYRDSGGRFYAFAADSQGRVRQFELTAPNNGRVQGTLVRSFNLSSAVVGMVVDDERNALFIAEQGVGLWRYDAAPTAGETRTQVDVLASGGLTSPLGGLGLYRHRGGGGYLLAASGGSNAVRLYQRAAPHAFVGAFSSVQEGSIDPVSLPRHVLADSRSLGTQLFPYGVVALHDTGDDTGTENFKLLPWPRVAEAFTPPLLSEAPVDGGVADGGSGDGGPGGGGGGGGGGGIDIPPTPQGCGCAVASVPGTALLVLAGLARRARRRTPQA